MGQIQVGDVDVPSQTLPAAVNEVFQEHRLLLDRTQAEVGETLAKAAEWCSASIRAGGKLIFFGNGGSAADAQHLATELVVRFERDRAPIAALALTTDTSALTAIGNDFGFDAIFSRQVAALGSERDVAIAISTSGESPNVLEGVKQARSVGIRTIALTGKGGGKLREVADLSLVVPSDRTARIQEMHLLIGHALCAVVEREAV